MGCDIHLFFEHKIDDEWHQIEIPELLFPDDRNYELFYTLAGVRGDNSEYHEPLFPSRGIPKDSAGKEWSKNIDYHNHTYAYLDEITRELKRFPISYFYVFCEYVLPRLFEEEHLDPMQERDVRVLMAFDT